MNQDLLYLEVFLLLFVVIFGLGNIIWAYQKYHKKQSLHKWSFWRMYYFFTQTFWGIGFVAVGTSILCGKFEQLSFVIYGMSFLLMTLVPCDIKISNTNLFMKISRNLLFIVIGLKFIFFL